MVRADHRRRNRVDRERPVVESRGRGVLQDAGRLLLPRRRLLRPGRRLGRDEPCDLGRGGRLVTVLLRRRVVYARRLMHDFGTPHALPVSTSASHLRTSSTAPGSSRVVVSPISFRTWTRSSCASASDRAAPPFRTTYATRDWPFSACGFPTTAASATFG